MNKIKPQKPNAFYDIWLNSTNSAEEVSTSFMAELEESWNVFCGPVPPLNQSHGKLYRILQSPRVKSDCLGRLRSKSVVRMMGGY